MCVEGADKNPATRMANRVVDGRQAYVMSMSWPDGRTSASLQVLLAQGRCGLRYTAMVVKASHTLRPQHRARGSRVWIRLEGGAAVPRRKSRTRRTDADAERRTSDDRPRRRWGGLRARPQGDPQSRSTVTESTPRPDPTKVGRRRRRCYLRSYTATHGGRKDDKCECYRLISE